MTKECVFIVFQGASDIASVVGRTGHEGFVPHSRSGKGRYVPDTLLCLGSKCGTPHFLGMCT